MTTTVKHAGKARSWEGPIENWEAHSEVIKHWCDGGDVESYDAEHIGDEWRHESKPSFCHRYDHRIKQRTPKAGEVWSRGNDVVVCTISPEVIPGLGLISLDGRSWHCLGHEGRFIAPNLESYYASKLLKHAYRYPTVDSSETENAIKSELFGLIKQLAGECNEKL